MESHYRKRVRSKGLLSFRVLIKETDLWISAERRLVKEAEAIVFNLRYQIESYIQSHPSFLTTLEPYPIDPFAPQIIQEMIKRTREVGIGPMAAVAGAIAQETGNGLLQYRHQQCPTVLSQFPRISPCEANPAVPHGDILCS